MTEELVISEGQFMVPYWMQNHISDPSLLPWSSHPQVGIQMYVRAPLFAEGGPALNEVVTIADLNSLEGWLPISGNLTSTAYSGEMGPLYVEMNASADNLSESLSLVVKPYADAASWTPALLEDGRGWTVSTGVFGIEQEQVVTVAMYLIGHFDGKNNPILFITDQGLGVDLLKGGSLYGMTRYTPSIAPSILTNNISITNRRVVGSVTRLDYTATVTTTSQNRYSVGDLVRIIDWTTGSDINRVVRVTSIVDSYTIQVTMPTAATSTVVFNGPNLCWVEEITQDIHPGTLLLRSPTPAYEPPNVAHTWLKPQRANLLANPRLTGPKWSDEVSGWRTKRTASGTADLTVIPTTGPGPFIAFLNRSSVTDHSAIVVESNKFPLGNNNFFSVCMDLYAQGTIRVGLVAWDAYYTKPTYIRLQGTAPALADGTVIVNNLTVSGTKPTFGTPVTVTGTIPELYGSAEYSLRIELIDYTIPFLGFSKGMVDPTEAQTIVFDGDTNDGLPQDFRWHGGSLNKGKHFSVWYNNRQNTEARLFGGIDEQGVQQDGLLDEWIPTDASVIPHWDAVDRNPIEGWTGDYLYPLKPVHNDTVLSYPWQEFDQDLLPVYTFGLTDNDGGLIRDEKGAVITVVYGDQLDSLLLTDDGEPIYANDNSYLLVS